MKLKVQYRCAQCGLEGHKLWRPSHVFLDAIELLCAVCGEAQEGVLQKKRRDSCYRPNALGWHSIMGDLSDQLGGLVPAVPVDGEATFWGYTSGPSEAVRWWHELPTYQDPLRELVWLRAWGRKWFDQVQYCQERELERLGIRPK